MGRESEWVGSKYDGRRQEPPYECPACADKDLRLAGLLAALDEIRNYWNGSESIGAMSDACERMIEMADVAIAAAQGGH